MKNKIFAERLAYAMELRNVKKAQDLARMTGIDKAAISNYLNGKYIPKTDKQYLIATCLNVNEAWLLGSDIVPMDRRTVPTDTMFHLSEEEVILIEQYRKGDDAKKRFLMYAAKLKSDK